MFQNERIINKMPLLSGISSPQDISSHRTNEFEQDVKDYCRNIRLNTNKIE